MKEKDLQIRIPAEAHRNIKAMAARRGITMREMIQKLAKAWNKMKGE